MRLLRNVWCRIFHKDHHVGFSSRGKTEWMCFECNHRWIFYGYPKEKVMRKPKDT